jgi:hypothetical protein
LYGKRSLNHLNISDADDIIHACGSLIEHNSLIQSVTFSHETVRKYLEDHKDEMLCEPWEIALSCLTYLLYHEFDEPAPDGDTVPATRKDLTLGNYASLFWPEHVRESEKDRKIEVEIAVFDAFRSSRRCRVIAEAGGSGPYNDLIWHGLYNLIWKAWKERLGLIFTKSLPGDAIASR